MKVLKFGGTSVGSVENLQKVKGIVGSLSEPAVVVVSAVGGITDKLLSTARTATCGTDDYLAEYNQIVERHRTIIKGLLEGKQQEDVLQKVELLHNELANL